MDGLTREFLTERDLRIFQMRKTGMATQEIAKKFGITTKAVGAAVQRQLSRLNREALLAYPEVLRMELERLDTLQQAIWPLTQHRKIKAPDGSEIVVEPDLRAIQQTLSIMDRRSKLLGMEAINVNINDISEAPVRATLADAAERPAAVSEFDPETEARRLIELMGQAGVLPPDTVESLLGTRLELVAPAPDLDDDEILIPDEVIP